MSRVNAAWIWLSFDNGALRSAYLWKRWFGGFSKQYRRMDSGRYCASRDGYKTELARAS